MHSPPLADLPDTTDPTHTVSLADDDTTAIDTVVIQQQQQDSSVKTEPSGLNGATSNTKAESTMPDVPNVNYGSGPFRLSFATWRGLATALYCGSFIALGLVIGVLGPTLPSLAQVAQTSRATMGWTFTGRGTGVLTGSIVGGFLYDKLKRQGHWIMFISLVMMGITMALGPFAAIIPVGLGPIVSVAVFYLMGIGCGAVDNGESVSTLASTESTRSFCLLCFFI